VKWADGYDEALEQSMGMNPFLCINSQQGSFIGFIQRLRQFTQNPSDTWQKTPMQSFNLAVDPLKPLKRFELLIGNKHKSYDLHTPSLLHQGLDDQLFVFFLLPLHISV